MRKIKSYARMIGKRLSPLCQSLLITTLPKYQLQENKLYKITNLHVEIGFGNGDFIYNQALLHPEINFLGAEVYMNGVCNLLKLCKIKPLNNLFIHVGDADLLLEKLANNLVDTFYIFFPDPWPKKRHIKRRFINETRLNLLANKLKTEGKIKFITDIENYFDQVLLNISEHPLLLNKDIFNFDRKLLVKDNEKLDTITANPLLRMKDRELYVTKYCQKALEQGRSIFSLTAYKDSSTKDNLRFKKA